MLLLHCIYSIIVIEVTFIDTVTAVVAIVIVFVIVAVVVFSVSGGPISAQSPQATGAFLHDPLLCE